LGNLKFRRRVVQNQQFAEAISQAIKVPAAGEAWVIKMSAATMILELP